MIKPCGFTVSLTASAPHGYTGIVLTVRRHAHACLFAEILYGIGKIKTLYVPNKIDGVPARAAAEAIVRLRVAINDEARSFFGVKRAQCNGCTCPAVTYFGVFGDKLLYVNARSQLCKKIVTETHAAHLRPKKK